MFLYLLYFLVRRDKLIYNIKEASINSFFLFQFDSHLPAYMFFKGLQILKRTITWVVAGIQFYWCSDEIENTIYMMYKFHIKILVSGHNKVSLNVTQSLRMLYSAVPLNAQELMDFLPIRSDSPVQLWMIYNKYKLKFKTLIWVSSYLSQNCSVHRLN